MTQRTSPAAAAIVAVLASTLLPACFVIHADSHLRTTGRAVSAETLSRIEPGRDREFVLALIGEPTSRTALEGGVEIWKWVYEEKRTRSSGLLLVVDSDETTERTGTTYVELRDGVVVKAWQD